MVTITVSGSGATFSCYSGSLLPARMTLNSSALIKLLQWEVQQANRSETYHPQAACQIPIELALRPAVQYLDGSAAQYSTR